MTAHSLATCALWAGIDRHYRGEEAVRNCQTIVALMIGALVAFAEKIEAQSSAGKPVYETLVQKPLPEDTEPQITVTSLPIPLATPVPSPPGPKHTHTGPVFA